MTVNLQAFMAECTTRVDQALAHLLPTDNHQTRLHEAMAYSLFNGGKRVRPLLVIAASLAVASPQAVSTATIDHLCCAIEAIHAYSLVHDDLPAMDDDELRRGKPTCHIAFGEATAILAGDALQAFAFEVISELPDLAPLVRIKIIQQLAHASGASGMVLGQAIDLAAVDRKLTLGELETMHRFKTGALIKAAVIMGATAMGATDQELSALERYATAIGLAFQVQDDILDVVGNTQTLGKQQGADVAHNKPTYVSLLGLDNARAKAQQLHVDALNALDQLGESANYLRAISAYIIERDH